MNDIEERKQHFLKRLEDTWPQVKLVGEYINYGSNTEFYCEEHSQYFTTSPMNILNRKSCCPEGVKITASRASTLKNHKPIEYFLNILEEKFDGNIIILDPPEHFTSSTILTFYCKKHNHKFTHNLRSVIRQDNPCRMCEKEFMSKKELEKAKNDFIEKFYSQDRYKNYKIIDIDSYTGTNNKMEFECDKGHRFFRTPSDMLLREEQCPYCYPTKKRIISWKEKFPEKLKYIVNLDELDEYKINKSVVITKCPDCGNIKRMLLSNFLHRDFHCSYCDKDSITYPNKILRQLFFQLKETSIIYEYKINRKEGGYFYYDGYFEKDGKEYCVEMDGDQHRTGSFVKNEKRNVKERDKEKEECLREKGIELIRIKCYKSEINYIKNNIIDSKLAELFDLSNIDWDKIDENSQKTWVKLICKDFSSGDYSVEKLINKYNLKKPTILKSLKKGNKFGWCEYNGLKEMMKKRGHGGYRVCQEDKEVGIFYSASQISNLLEEKYNIKIKPAKISFIANDSNKYKDEQLKEKHITIKRIELQNKQ